MNFNLKKRILETYRTQSDFARIAKISEAVVSRAIRERIDLTEEEKQRWAVLLRCKPDDVFEED